MILVGLAAALLTIFCAGYGLVMLIVRAPGRLNALECLSLSWLLGSGVVSLLLWIFGLGLSGLPLQIAVTAGCLLLAVFGWRVSARGDVQIRLLRPATSIEWLLAGVITAEVALMFLMSFQYPLGWDGLLNWEIKARYAFLNGGVLPAAYFTDVSRSFSHPDYPLYLPFVELWTYLWMGEPHQFWVKIIFPIYFAAGTGIMACAGARLSGRRWAGMVAAALLFFVPFLTTTGYGGVLHGYADFPLGVFYLAVISYLLLAVSDEGENSLRLSLFLLALLPWVKREGAILWAVAVCCGVLVIWRRQKSWRWLLGFLPGLVVMIAWQIFLKFVHALRPEEFVGVSFSVLQANAGRAFPILRGLCIEMSHTNRWSVFWPLIVLAFVYLFIRARNLRLALLSVALVGPIAAYCGTYFFSAWADYFAHMSTSLPRLLLQMVPLAGLVLALVLPPPAAQEREGRSPATRL